MFRVNKKKPILIITTELPVSWTTGRKVVVSKLKKKILSGWPLLTMFKLLLEVTLQEAIIGIF